MKKTLCAILVGTTLAGSAISSSNADDFRVFLKIADCNFLDTGYSIDLRVFGMKFPLKKGFYFLGHEVEGVTFRRNSYVIPTEYMQQNTDVAPKDTVAFLSAQQVSVVCSKSEQKDGLK